MRLGLDRLLRLAAATGFAQETLEKALRLVSLLSTMNEHPFLRGRYVLKGGTATFMSARLIMLGTPRPESTGLCDTNLGHRSPPPAGPQGHPP